MGELNQSHVNYAADLQKCLHTRLVLVSVYLFSRFFFNSYIEKTPPKSGEVKANHKNHWHCVIISALVP